MRTIIAATDLSPVAKNAAYYAADMALALDAELFLLHIYVPPINYGEITVPLVYDTWQKDAELEMVRWKREILAQLKHPLHVRWEVRMGMFMTELKGACARTDPYAVIIGATGKTAAERILFGSHAIETLKHLPWPVICVPPGARFNSIRKVGLACDFIEVKTTVPIREIEHLVADFQAELHILHIGKEEAFNPNAIYSAGFLRDHLKDVNLQFHFIQDTDIDQAILDFALNNKIDLLVVLPRRHSFLDALIHKSHTRQFVLHNQVPMMAMHMGKRNDGIRNGR